MNAERETRKTLRNGLIFAAVNLVGAVIYLWLSSRIPAQRALEDRDYYDGVDGMTYCCTALPVVYLFFLIGCIYLIYAVVVLIRHRNTTLIIFCGLVLALWLVTAQIDSYIAWIPKGTWHWYNAFPFNRVELTTQRAN